MTTLRNFQGPNDRSLKIQVYGSYEVQSWSISEDSMNSPSGLSSSSSRLSVKIMSQDVEIRGILRGNSRNCILTPGCAARS